MKGIGWPLSRFWRAALDLGLRKKVAIVFIGMLLFSGLNLGLLHHMLQDFNGVASTATVAGKLRMLGQKLAYETLALSVGLRPPNEDIEHDIVDFDAAYLVLRSGGAAFGDNIRPLAARHDTHMKDVWLSWQQYRDLVRKLVAVVAMGGAEPRELSSLQNELSAAAGALLAYTDILIQDLVTEAQQTQENALENMYRLLLLNALILLTAYLAMSTQIVAPLQRLARHCLELARGNYDERTPPASNDEIGQLAAALNHSGQKIGELFQAIERERKELRRTSAMFQGLARNAVAGVFVMDTDMRFRYVNRKLAEMFGYSPDEMAGGLSVNDLLPDPQADGARERSEKLSWERLSMLSTSHHETRARRRDGSIIDIEVFASRMALEGTPAVIGIALNVTARKKAQASERRAALVYSNTSEAVVITDADAVILDVNPAFTAITGYERSEAIGRRMNLLASGRHDAAFYSAMWQGLRSTGRWSGDIWNRRKNGEEYVERLTIDTSYNEDGSVNCHIGLFSDVTVQRRKEETIWRQAHFDHLTGLPNRQMFHEELRRAMDDAERDRRSLALIYLDLDLFKEVNDSLGHDMGDELLKEVARRLRDSVRDGDLVARLGGDEFTLILEQGEDVEHIEGICRRVIETVSEPYVIGHNVVSISASLGVTRYPRDGRNVTELLKNADLAMYSAKDAGRNQYCHFSMTMQREAQERRELLREMQLALENREFELYFQPVVDMGSMQICKAEALLRWHHPRRGMVPPGDFIPLAEDSGTIVPIGDWVFREAVTHAARWSALNDGDFQISVNVSPVQFMAEGLDPQEWVDWAGRQNVKGCQLVVEITERMLMRTDGASRDKLLAFRDAGVSVALDDFGTGYSSLSYLKRFDIDFLKIDQLFVRNITAGSDDLALCQAIIAMAHRLGLKVVAEGVATEEQHWLLAEAGCDYAQGFLYSQPLNARHFEALLMQGAAVVPGLSVTP